VFSLAKDTFDAIPISVEIHLKSEAESAEGTREVSISVDKEPGLLDRQFLTEFAEKLPRNSFDEV